MSMKTKMQKWIREHLCRGIKTVIPAPNSVIPVKTGIQTWIPAYARMTEVEAGMTKQEKRAAIFGRGFAVTKRGMSTIKKVITVAVILVVVAISHRGLAELDAGELVRAGGWGDEGVELSAENHDQSHQGVTCGQN